MSVYASWYVFSTSLYPFSFPITSPVFLITLVTLLAMEIVSKRHFWEPGINWQTGGLTLWPHVGCDLEVSNCLHFYKSNLSTYFGVKFIAGYILAVHSLTSQAQNISPLIRKWAFAEKYKEMSFLLELMQWWGVETPDETFSRKEGAKRPWNVTVHLSVSEMSLQVYPQCRSRVGSDAQPFCGI